MFKCCLIVQVFAAEYYQYNKDGVIKSEDAAYVLSFAIMMLHTDLHNPSVRRHMTKKDWLRMNRGQNMTQPRLVNELVHTVFVSKPYRLPQ